MRNFVDQSRVRNIIFSDEFSGIDFFIKMDLKKAVLTFRLRLLFLLFFIALISFISICHLLFFPSSVVLSLFIYPVKVDRLNFVLLHLPLITNTFIFYSFSHFPSSFLIFLPCLRYVSPPLFHHQVPSSTVNKTSRISYLLRTPQLPPRISFHK